MPLWAQWFTRLNPVTYFIEVTRLVILKGSSLADISLHVFIMIGFAVCGLNSGFTQTFRIYQDPNNYTDYYKEKNFIFPAATAGFGWQKNRFYGELKFGYCWDNPTLFNTPFLFPEISIQYQLFNLAINK